MSTLLYTILGLSASLNLHCSMRKEISPCTCRRQEASNNIAVSCERMTSFAQVLDALQDKFSPTEPISLKITYSNLEDLPHRNFNDLNMTIVTLKLNHDNLSDFSDYSFGGLDHTTYFSLADNTIPAIPRHILARMPYVKTIDIGRGRIQSLSPADFKGTPLLEYLVLPGNGISILEEQALPTILKHLHIGRNMLTTLNGTLRDMVELEWLFINSNFLTSLDGELPQSDNKLMLIHASNNSLTKLPQDLKNLQKIESLFFQQNLITSLDGAVSKSKKLKRLQLGFNRIHTLSETDFIDTESLQDLQLGYNNIASLNNSLLPLRALRNINLTHNRLKEFSLQEIRGLTWLRIVDLSHNKISKLGGRMENLVEWETRVIELRLDHNELKRLDGSLNGLHGLLRLNLSHNKITSIAPDDLIGLEELRMLDISYNHLTTLEETSKTFLPSLEELLASHNSITMLERDFHGLPVLCWADLSNNQIKFLGKDLVAKTRCMVHGIPSILKIYLQDNPILCDDELPEIMSAMEVNHTRIHGASQCIPTPPPALSIVPLPVSLRPIPEGPAYEPLLNTPSPMLPMASSIDTHFVIQDNQIRNLNLEAVLPIHEVKVVPLIIEQSHQQHVFQPVAASLKLESPHSEDGKPIASSIQVANVESAQLVKNRPLVSNNEKVENFVVGKPVDTEVLTP